MFVYSECVTDKIGVTKKMTNFLSECTFAKISDQTPYSLFMGMVNDLLSFHSRDEYLLYCLAITFTATDNSTCKLHFAYTYLEPRDLFFSLLLTGVAGDWKELKNNGVFFRLSINIADEKESFS